MVNASGWKGNNIGNINNTAHQHNHIHTNPVLAGQHNNASVGNVNAGSIQYNNSNKIHDGGGGMVVDRGGGYNNNINHRASMSHKNRSSFASNAGTLEYSKSQDGSLSTPNSNTMNYAGGGRGAQANYISIQGLTVMEGH